MSSSPTVIPNLWFNRNAAEAAEFYVDAFAPVLPGDTQIERIQHYPHEGLPDFQADFAGEVLSIDIRLGDTQLTLINADDTFSATQATSFFVNFDPSVDPDARMHLDALWAKLTDGGTVLMELDQYPHSPHYGWVQDQYGFSWQLMLTNPDGEPRPSIIACFLFNGAVIGRAEEALRRWVEAVPDSRLGAIVTYPQDMGAAAAGSLMFGDARLGPTEWVAAMDAAAVMDLPFTEAVSFALLCDDQDEIDRLWDGLSRVPDAEQCGWCKDEFGVSWQVVPAQLPDIASDPGAYARMLTMGKLIIAEL